MRESIDPTLTTVETPIVYLPGHDQGEPKLATPGSAGYDLPAILTRACLTNDGKRFFSWKGKRQQAEKRVEANKPPVIFGNVVQWLQSERQADIAQIKAMQKFPSQYLHLKIQPGETIRIPLGIKTAIPSDMQVHLYARASSATKGFRLGNCVGVIDSDYPNEWYAAIRNCTTEPIAIQHGQRIVQAVFAPRILSIWSKSDVLPTPESRIGGFGSTGDAPLQAAETAATASAGVSVTEALDGEMTPQAAAGLAQTGGELPSVMAEAGLNPVLPDDPISTTAAGQAVASMIDEASPDEEAALDAAIAAEERGIQVGVDQSQDASDTMPAEPEAGEVHEIQLICGKVRVGPVAKYRPATHDPMSVEAVVGVLTRELTVLAPKAIPLMVQKLREPSDETGADS